MNKNNHWLSIITLLLLAANIVTLVLLWTNNRNTNSHERPAPQGAVFEFLTRELGLTEQQQYAYSQLRDQHQSAQRQMQDSIRHAKDALFSLLQKNNIADSLLQEYSKRTALLEQQLDIITFKHFQQVRALCNPEQQHKFDKIIQDVLRRMGGPGRPPPVN